MSISHVTNAGIPDARVSGGRLSLSGAADFASELNLGQIIKGKVLRQYEGGGRYLMEFNGRERVVDSGVPLTTGELIHGRVVGLGDRVELQRVHSGADETAPTQAPTVAVPRHEQLIDDIASRYRATLGATDRAVLTQTSRLAGDPNAMATAGMMLHKLGLGLSPELLWPVYRALQREDASSAALLASNEALELQVTNASATGAPSNGTRELAESLIRQLQDGPTRDSLKHSASDDGRSPAQAQALGAAVTAVGTPNEQGQGGTDPRQLARWLLNAQTEGTVAHRLGTVPFLFGDKLIEVDLSFFEQQKDAARPTPTQHRKLVFSLRTEHLGTVQIAAHVAGTRVRLQIATDREDATTAVSSYAQELRSTLSAAGWDLDEMVYQTSQADSQNGVVRSVVEHIISQNSLSRLA